MSTNFGPASGQFHLVLDDGVNDAVFSQVHAALQLDLSNKKNVVLSFKAKSLGNEPHGPFGTDALIGFDGVSISANGGTNWQLVEALSWIGGEWQALAYQLDYYASGVGGFGPDFRIRFSEYDNAAAPLDGIAIDDVVITADADLRAVLEVPTQVVEGSGPHTGYVFLSFEPTNTLELVLSVTPAGQITLPASVVIPAGQNQASFSFSVPNDNLVNLTRLVTIRPMTGGVTALYGYITIRDDDAPVVTVSMPAELREGVNSDNNARITLDRAPDVPMNFYFSVTPWDELEFWNYALISPGETQAVFTVNAADDFRIDGNVPVTIVVRSDGVVPVTNQLITVDNELRALELILPPTILEGATATGSVRLSGTLSSNLHISLISSNPGALTVPPVVTVVAWETTATFEMSGADNTQPDGSRSVAINASASTFTSTNGSITIRDNEVAGYWIGGLSNIVNVTDPVSITVRAADVEGNSIGGATGPVNLSLVFPDGTSLPLTPATVNLSSTEGWTGNVTLPPVHSGSLRLHAEDSAGRSGDSMTFDIMRVLNLPTSDLVWDAVRQRIYASVPADAAGTNANQVVVIDPFSAEMIGGVVTGQDPGQLALTSGGENLYVAQNANGYITRIDPATMTVAATFAVGTSPIYGTLYADDLCTVAGQPDLLVVSQFRQSVSPRHNGVAVYENGVARALKTQDHTGSNLIEPSADPYIFFGYNTETTEYGFRRLQLSAAGMTEVEVNRSLIYSRQVRSDGDRVFTDGGVVVNGAEMRRVGNFAAQGLVCPDLAVNRVYFLEPQGPYYYYDYYDAIGTYDPTTFSNVRRLTLPVPVYDPSSFIRWGSNGLAFLTSSNVVLINSSRLVPSGPPANLSVVVNAAPNPAAVGVPVAYSVSVSNQGPSLARNSFLSITLGGDQAFESVAATNGMPVTVSNTIALALGDLAVGESATMTVTTLPALAGNLYCLASVTSEAIDPDFTDNRVAKFVSVGFQAAVDSVNRLRLPANNLIYDPTRNWLWASLPAGVASPLGSSVVAIDPTTGLISDPIPISGDPTRRCMALSKNGRYLYVGLVNSPEIQRIDLEGNNAGVLVPLGLNGWNQPAYAADIEPLEGDGTSILITTSSDRNAAVFDGFVRRADRLGYTVDRIEKTADPAIFVGSDSYTLTRLRVTNSGVVVVRQANNLINYADEIQGAGDLVLSSSGLLANSGNLTLKANWGMSGTPCLDLSNHRAYLVNGNMLHGFDTRSLLPAADFTLPTSTNGYWAETCVRWGTDGFAILGGDTLYIFRWSAAVVPPVIPQVALSNMVAGNYLVLSWPAYTSGFALECATNLTPPVVWLPVPVPPVTLGDQTVVTNTIGEGSRFFRLRVPSP